MDDAAKKKAGLIACVVGSLLMATALAGHDWFVGERDGLDIKGGVIDVLFCSKPDDRDPMPMSIGGHDGCYSEMYARSPLQAQAGSWFGTTTHMTLFLSGGATGLLLLMALISGLGFRIQVVPYTEQLALQILELGPGVMKLQFHPGARGSHLGFMSLGVLGIAVSSAPAGLSVGSDVIQLVGGCLLAITGSALLDSRTLVSESKLIPPAEVNPGAEGEAAATALPEAEIDLDDDDGPACRRCEAETLWLEKVGRHRCQKCGLYQPLHAPGTQVDQ